MEFLHVIGFQNAVIYFKYDLLTEPKFWNIDRLDT